jgi:hypothetical protein
LLYKKALCKGGLRLGLQRTGLPSTRAEGERWAPRASALNVVFRNATKFYLYSKRDPFYYLASHTCAADNVTLNKWVYNGTIH